MVPAPVIHYLRQNEVDRVAWDRCIKNAGNGRIYGDSFFLDAMADNWDALVLENYEAVMPLPWRKKWGVPYLYQPFLTAQLGLFGNQLTPALLASFLRAIPKKFRLWEFPLNQGNLFDVPGFGLYERSNFILSLRASYEELRNGYRENIRRNCKKCLQYGCSEKKDLAVDEVIRLVREQNRDVDEKGLVHFRDVFLHYEGQSEACTYGIASKDGQLLSAVAFLFSHQRAYYLLAGNHPNGRTLGASHRLIDAFIRDHADRELLLDFEGSDLHNLAFFYSSFGAKEERYAAVRMNRLPFYLKWLKR